MSYQKKWKISQRRIVRMALDGKIKDAKLYGRSWMFPINSIKPIDGRTKIGKEEKQKKIDNFRYPIYEYKNISSFHPPLSRDELTLKALTETFNACHFEDAEALLGKLPEKTENRYIHIAALYCGCMISFSLGKMEQFLNYYGQLKTETQDDIPYKLEMSEYVHELEATLGSDDYYSSRFHARSAIDYHESFLPRLCNLSSLWIALGSKPVTSADLTANEIICKFLTETDNYFDLQAVHIYLACAYSMNGKDKECHYHFTQALKLAKKYDMFYTIASMQYYYMPESLEKALVDFPSDFKERVLECNRLVNECYLRFTNALQFNSVYKLLKGKDCIYLMLANQGLTNKEVALRMHKSIGTIGKRYGEIYSLLGVKNKAEAIALYRTLISNSHIQ